VAISRLRESGRGGPQGPGRGPLACSWFSFSSVSAWCRRLDAALGPASLLRRSLWRGIVLAAGVTPSWRSGSAERQLQGNRPRKGRSRFSHGIHSHSRHGRAHRWGAHWRRRRCRTAGRPYGTGCPPEPCSGSPGRRIAAWWVSPGSSSWPLRARYGCVQSDAASSGRERGAGLTANAGQGPATGNKSTRLEAPLSLRRPHPAAGTAAE
jgi:hypothetical protein